MENWACGRKKHVWVTTSNDLKVDARRDLDDVDGDEVQVRRLGGQVLLALITDMTYWYV
jgi:hypothetical protein